MKPAARLASILSVVKECKIGDTEIAFFPNKWDEEENPESKTMSTHAWAKLPDSDIYLSMQTHPLFTGTDALCGTALIGGEEQTVVYVKELGYGEVVLHQTADEFKSHLATLMTRVKGKKLADMTATDEPSEDAA
jgi:hypothetical protein